MPKKDTLVTGKAMTYPIPNPAGGVKLETFIPWTLVKRGVRKQVITPLDAPDQFQEEAAVYRQEHKAAQDSPLLKALGLAHHWQRLLDEGRFKTLGEIAAAEQIDKGQASRIARMTQLAPDIIETWLAGEDNVPALENLNRSALPIDWEIQRHRLIPGRD